MTSGLIYAFQFMADYPEVFAKVRQEQLELRGGPDVPITLDVLDESPYLRAFVKEVLRLRRESTHLLLFYVTFPKLISKLCVFSYYSPCYYGSILSKEGIPN